MRLTLPVRPKWLKSLSSAHPLARLGPGLITGVADDDPSGIATYAQAGAAYGYGMLWTMPLAYPLMSAVQSMAARLGRVTGKGLAANIKSVFPAWILKSLVALLLVANILNIAADIAAMGEAAELVSGIGRQPMTIVFVIATLALQIFVPYHRYVVFLKWFTAALLSYAALLFVVHVPWTTAIMSTFVPHFRLDWAAATMIIAVFGTTISPYLFFWQASEEVEDMRGSPSLLDDKAAAKPELRRIAWDTWTGMLYSDLSSYFIILATAVTLHVAGITQIDTAAQAASSLEPLAGRFATLLFAIGILGVGMIGVPVLAGSAGYALCEAMDWRWGLERSAKDARAFYAVITFSVLLALLIQYLPISPMRALFWSAVVNGIVAVPLLAVLVILVSKPSVMGPFVAGAPLRWLGWSAAAIMSAASIGTLLGVV